MRLFTCLSTVVALAAACLCSSVNADDIVLKWNQQVLDSIRAEKTPPPIATRALAMTHIAIYDALNEIEGNHRPYSFNFPGVSVLNPPADVSASTAAYIVLKRLYPNRDAQFRTLWLSSFKPADGAIKNAAAVAWGSYVGNLVNSYRAGDGSTRVVNYVPRTGCLNWRPTLPLFAPALLPQWPRVRPFGVGNVVFFRAPAPPRVSTDAFASAYREVFELGSATSTTRTADQKQIAYFWEDGAGTVTPPGHWQVITRSLSERFLLSRIENARLFALLSIAQADAAISCWDTKYWYNFARPIQAIRERCFNRRDLPQDVNWTPLIPTPPFPAYTSGHSTFSGASSRILELYFGTDNIAFSGPSPDPQRWPNDLPGVVRSWTSFSQAAEEAGMSRIYGGIHWQFDNVEGLAAGRAIADQVFDLQLRPE